MKNLFPLQTGSKIKITVRSRLIGADTFTVIAGPCTIENYEDLLEIALELKKRNICFLRGGAYKLRTSPYSFPGLGITGLEILKRVCAETGLISVSEITSAEDVSLFSDLVDIIQIGTRNMHNYRLLEKLGDISNPVILKRGLSSTIEEWLYAAEHILKAGNPNVILCERGIRTFETYTRNTLDISAIPAVRNLSNLPVIIDPSHSSGRRELIRPLSWAAAAAGADGIIMETHFRPDKVICDSEQTIDLTTFDQIYSGFPELIALWQKHIQE